MKCYKNIIECLNDEMILPYLAFVVFLSNECESYLRAFSGEACYRRHLCPHRCKSVQMCDKSHVQMKLLAICFSYIIACVCSRYVALLYVLKTTFLLISLLQIFNDVNNVLKKNYVWFARLALKHKNSLFLFLSRFALVYC